MVMRLHNVDYEYIKHVIKDQEYVFDERMIFLDTLKKKILEINNQ